MTLQVAPAINPWLLLAAAIAVEVFGTTALKLSAGLTKAPWVVACLAAYICAFSALAVAVKTLPLGLAYAVWAGIGTIGAFIVGWLLFDEPAVWSKWLGAALVVAGICVLNGGPAVAETPASAPAPAGLSPGAYLVDASGSELGFEVSNFLLFPTTGHFGQFTGTVTLASDFSQSKVQGSAEVKSLTTANDKRDEHLRSADFFDAATYPRITFTSSQISGSPQAFQLKGTLTIRDTAKEVVFSGSADSEPGLFSAEAKINRQDFHVSSGATIANEVKLILKLHLVPAPAGP